jgi:hypothetical protein
MAGAPTTSLRLNAMVDVAVVVDDGPAVLCLEPHSHAPPSRAISASAPIVSMAQMMIWDAVMRVPTAFVPISVVPKSGPTHSDDWELLWDTGAICPNVPTVPAGRKTLPNAAIID